jgi:predicted  nucleic acid-binding Zn-ribbon protein
METDRRMYEELLEKLRKNNRMSGWTHIDRLMDEAAEAIEALQHENNGWQERYYELDAGHSRLFKDFCKLQKENEQLQAQVARVREALRKAREALCKGISELKVHCKYFDNTPEEDACIEMHEAILEIDKAIGGKEW